MRQRTVHVLLALPLLAMITAPALAAQGDHLVRTRLIFISPDDDSDGALRDLNLSVESDTTVELDYSYFFRDNWAIEAILATAAQPVEIEPPVEEPAKQASERVALGSVYHAPATVLGQYHFKPEGKVRPYIGAGVNITIFYNESGMLDDTFDIDSSSIGPAVQFGIDFMTSDRTSFNIDLKYTQIETDVELDGDTLGTVEVNPFILGFGFGWRF